MSAVGLFIEHLSHSIAVFIMHKYCSWWFWARLHLG